jgi:hypothetical protein
MIGGFAMHDLAMLARAIPNPISLICHPKRSSNAASCGP